MNRIEFMAQLERLLYDLPENERQDALYYYNDYFDDAGKENEGSIIQELGSPGKVAAIIRASYRGSHENQGEYTENGYRDNQFSDKGQMPATQGNRDESKKEQRDKRDDSNSEYKEKQTNTNGHPYQGTDWKNQGHGRRGVGSWVLIIIALIFLGPMVLGVGAGAIGILFGLLGAVVSLLFSGFALAGAGIAGIVKGAFLAASSPAIGLVTIGGGLILLALGLLLILFFAWLLFKIVPKAFRGILNLVSRVFHQGRGKDEGGTRQ